MSEQITGRGSKIIARCYGNQAKVNVVYSWDKYTRCGPKVYLTSESVFADILSGKSSLSPIGFPAEDVFVFDETFDLTNPDWSKLTLWLPTVSEQPEAPPPTV